MADSIWFWLFGFAVAMTVGVVTIFWLPLALIAAIARAPQAAASLGVEAGPWQSRLVVTVVLLATGYALVPQLTALIVAIALVFLALAIPACLLLALAYALFNGGDAFGSSFWHFGRHAVPLCAAFALLVVPFGYGKWKAVQDIQSRSSGAARVQP